MSKILKEHDELVTIRLPRPLKEWLRSEAEKEELSLSAEIRSLLELWRTVEEEDRSDKTHSDRGSYS